MRTAWLCDFDGTISPEDIGASFVRAFSPGQESARREMLDRWMAGDLGHRALTEAECAIVRASAADALAFTQRFAIDPTFPAFVAAVRAVGDHVLVVSEGFDFYVRDQLERAGLGDVPHAANRVRFEGTRVVPEFPFEAESCGACGNCKAHHVRTLRRKGFHTVLVGDGYSDRCGAREADIVLARGGLLAWCGAQGIDARAFDHFGDVLDWATSRTGHANGARAVS